MIADKRGNTGDTDGIKAKGAVENRMPDLPVIRRNPYSPTPSRWQPSWPPLLVKNHLTDLSDLTAKPIEYIQFSNWRVFLCYLLTNEQHINSLKLR